MNPFLSRGANLELCSDSVSLKLLPLKDSVCVYKGEQVVVAEFDVHPADSIDSLWVKLAHSEEVQGWIRQTELDDHFVPTDIISRFMHLFSNSYTPWFLTILAAFVLVCLYRYSRRKSIRMVYFNDIESVYPLLLCLLMSVSATLYGSIQQFEPAMWQHYYFNPTLSPFEVPWPLSLFLVTVWGIFVMALASVEEAFRYLKFGTALLYLLGLLSVCIVCYFFFTYIGGASSFFSYILLLGFAGAVAVRVSRSSYNYRCGRCGAKMNRKGTCSKCGVLNE